MVIADFAKCPKRTSTCPSPSYCAPTCRHISEPTGRQDEDTQVEEDGDVTLYHSAGALR